MTDMRLQAELARLREDNERLAKLTDYLRAGEVNIDEQERMWNEAQAEIARLREESRVMKAWADDYKGQRDELLEAVKEWNEAELDDTARFHTGWQDANAANRTARIIKTKASLCQLIEENDG